MLAPYLHFKTNHWFEDYSAFLTISSFLVLSVITFFPEVTNLESF